MYGSTAAGLYEIGLTCQLGACPGTVQIDNRYRGPSSLAYDARTGDLYLVGNWAPTLEMPNVEYPLDIARLLGERDLVSDGIVHPDLTRLSPLAAGLVNMEISRGDWGWNGKLLP